MADIETKIVEGDFVLVGAEKTAEATDAVDSNEPALKKQKLDDDAAPVVKSEAEEILGDTTADATDLQKEIIQQIEYYFGDTNLFRDKFMLAEIEKNNGWVEIKTLTTFKRLASLSTDIEAIVEALDKSLTGLLEISEDRTSIRRHPERPIPERNEELRKDIQSRTAYVKGFPLDAGMDQLLEFLKPYTKINHVVIRKYLDKPTKVFKPKGSIFVTFQLKEQCTEFLANDLKYNDSPLIAKWQVDYYAEKKAERAEKNKPRNDPKPQITLPKGSVLRLEGIEGDVTRELIKEQLAGLGGEVAFVDFNKGDVDGYVRLTEENAAKTLFAEKIENGKLSLGDAEVNIRVLEGEEEESFLNMCVDKMKARRNKSGGHRFNKRGRKNQD